MQPSPLRTLRNANRLFLLTVVTPVLLALLYYFVLASDVYISESRFIVRSPEKPSTAGLGVILQSAGFSNSYDEAFAAKAFVESRDALTALNRNDAVRNAYSSEAISLFDRFNALGFSGSFEDLFKYYQNHIAVVEDSTSSITTLTVRAYSPKDAATFNRQLLEMAEATVNRLNERGHEDLVRFASREVEDAKGKARGAALALAAFRSEAGVIDPQLQAQAKLQMISKLQDDLIINRRQLMQLRAFTPQNPQIPVITARIAEVKREIGAQMGEVVGDRRSLSSTTVQYQRLLLESQFADKQLAGAMSSLEQASNEARRKQAYVERIVQPNLPDAPLEPRRLRGVLATLALGLVAFAILRMLLAGVREHGQ